MEAYSVLSLHLSSTVLQTTCVATQTYLANCWIIYNNMLFVVKIDNYMFVCKRKPISIIPYHSLYNTVLSW